jgi:hypothetical protein
MQRIPLIKVVDLQLRIQYACWQQVKAAQSTRSTLVNSGQSSQSLRSFINRTSLSLFGWNWYCHNPCYTLNPSEHG